MALKIILYIVVGYIVIQLFTYFPEAMAFATGFAILVWLISLTKK